MRGAASRWLSDGVYVLEIRPFPDYAASKSSADRSKVPDRGPTPDATFPEMKRATLSNGLTLVVAERHSIPVVDFNLILDGGFAADSLAVPGLTRLAMEMLDEGTKTRDALAISDQLSALGARLNTGSDLDTSSVSLSALKANLDPSLAIFADVVLNPAFPQPDLDRLKRQQLARIQSEKVQPQSMALRVFPKLVFGEGHAYGTPFTGSGFEKTVAGITRDDLVKFHATWFKPNHAAIVVVGDTTLAEIQPKLEALFGSWKAGDVPKKNLKEVQPQPKQVVYLIDRPGSVQSMVIAGHVAPPKANPDEIAIEALNRILGGSFTSRINMNIREDKHWSYGAGSMVVPTSGQRPFVVFAPVQSDKTKETLAEISKELKGPLGDRAVTTDELEKAQDGLTLSLPGRWETGRAVGGSIAELLRYGLPDDYFATYPKKVRALTVANEAAAARQLLHPDSVVWVVVGDRSKIEGPIRGLGLGEVKLLDADGNPL